MANNIKRLEQLVIKIKPRLRKLLNRYHEVELKFNIPLLSVKMVWNESGRNEYYYYNDIEFCFDFDNFEIFFKELNNGTKLEIKEISIKYE